MNDPSPASLYAHHLDVLQARAAVALERGGFDHLVLPSGSLHYQVFDDRDYPYAVNPQFKAWLPLVRNPGSWLIVTPGRRPTLVYLQPRDYWHVVPRTPNGWWVEHVDIVVIRNADDALAHLPPPGRCAILGEPQSALGDYVPNNPPAVVAYLEYHRAFKTPYEIAMMRAASRIGVRAHRAAEAAFRDGASEFDIHLAYCAAARQDALELPYGNIVALNEHGAVLHYTELDRDAPREARSFLIDAGASHMGYACDITRTYSARRDDFQQMVDDVDAAQQAMCSQVRSGVDYRRIHLDAHLALARILKSHGVLTISPESAVETGVSGTFFPHGVGHGIGLQVHDVAGFAANDTGDGTLPKPDGHPFLRLTRTLAPGMVVTIEPGLYFIDMLLDDLRAGPHASAVDWVRVDAFRPFGGIRIEDDVACTDGAPENLTRDAFAQA